MKTVRKLLLAALSVMVLLACAVTANAEESGSCGENLTWTLGEAGILQISGTGPMEDYTSSNPAPWADQKNEILDVVIWRGVTSIGKNAFANCSYLQNVLLHEGIESINAGAFASCYRLTSINLPNGLKSIGNSAFYDCKSLKEADFPESLEKIEASAFWGCSKMEINGLPEGLTVLGNSAFRYCGAITQITIPVAITALGSSVFFECSGLESVTFLADTYTEIGSGAFQGCTSLKVIDLPKGIKRMESNVLAECTSLTAVGIPDSVTFIHMDAFIRSGTVNHLIFAGTWQQWSAISSGNPLFMPKYKVLHVETTMDAITAIENCEEDSVYCSLCVEKIQKTVLDGQHTYVDGVCTGCEQVLPFRYKTDSATGELCLTEYTGNDVYVEIPQTINGAAVTALEDTFVNNTVAKRVIIPASITYIKNGAGSFANCPNLLSITVAEENLNYCNDDLGAVYSEDMYTLVWVPRTSDYQYNVKSSVLTIGYMAFADCTQITQINMSTFNNCYVTKIDRYAFLNCTGLSGLSLPGTLEEIDSLAFEGCSNIEYFQVDNSWYAIYSDNWDGYLYRDTELVAVPQKESGELIIPNDLTTIGDNALRGCDLITKITVHDKVTAVGVGAFSDCAALKEIYLPGSLNSIGENAFAQLPALTDIYFDGTEDQWNQILTTEQGETFADVTIHFKAQVSGDMDGNDEITDADAMYLLRFTLFPDRYPVSGNPDFNKDGQVNDADAMYLLRYTLFPDRYPLN